MKQIKEIFINELNKEQYKDAYQNATKILEIDQHIKELENEIDKSKTLKKELINYIITEEQITAIGLEDKNVRISFIPQLSKIGGIDYAETFKGVDLETIKKYKTTKTETVEVWNDSLIENELRYEIKYKNITRDSSVRITPLVKEVGE